MLAEMIGGALRRRTERLDGMQHPGQWLIDWASGGDPTSSGEAINETNALNCPAVKAAVSLLSEAFAVSTIEICERKNPDIVVVVKDHDLDPVLNRQPNPETNCNTWWDAMQNHHGTWGNAYAFIQRNIRGTKVAALWNRRANPERTRPVRSKDDGQIYYECKDANGQLEAMVPAADMLHVRYLTLDGILGKSPVRLIRETIGGNKAAERIANEVFKNGDVTHGHYTLPGKVSEGMYARLTKSLNEGSEHGKRHRNKILEEGMKFEGTSYNLSEMQLIDARQYLDLIVAMAYNVDAQLLQMRAAGTLPLPDLLRKFITITLPFWGHRWEAEINAKLLQPPYFARWNFSAFLRNDRLAQSQEHRTNFSTGKQSINEMRHERGDNRLDDPNADEHYVPMNMVPLSLANEFAKATIARAKAPTSNPIGGDNREAPPGMPSGGGDGVQPGDANGQDGGRPESPLDAKPQANGGASQQLSADTSAACGFTTSADISREISPETQIGSQLALIEAEAVVAATLARLERVEANEALRAAKDPKTFLARLDTFYGKHVETLREALERPVRTVVLLRDGPLAGGATTDIEVDNTINEHVADKRAALLQVSGECKASELPARVAEVVREWGT